MNRFSVGLFFLAVGFAVVGSDAGEKKESKPIRVLFVGNSQIYFNDLPKIVETLSASAPKDQPRISTARAVYGGASLESHWNKGTEKDTARAKIAAEKWDYVIIQDYSSVTTKENLTKHA